jgi:hypothetical protein
LTSIEPTLQNAPTVTVSGGGTSGGYTLVATSVSGSSPDHYTLVDTGGAISRTCSGSGGGCPNGSW